MGLPRRQFTREFKLAALQRLEMGASVAEVARAFEVNPNVLHRWRREFRDGPGNAFPGLCRRRWEGSTSCIRDVRGRRSLGWTGGFKFGRDGDHSLTEITPDSLNSEHAILAILDLSADNSAGCGATTV